MNQVSTIRIAAAVSEAEQPVLTAAGEQLAEALAAASGTAWSIEIEFRTAISDPGTGEPATAIITSLLAEALRADEPFAQTEARVRNALAAVDEALLPSVFLCTVFRCVAGRAQGTLERIRRLNSLAIELSADLAISIVDIDRTLAEFGGRALQSDYRLSSPLAVEVAAYVIVDVLLAYALDDAVPSDVRARAQKFQGPYWEITTLLGRRMKNGTRTGSRG